jgi:hypothetical protein
MKRRAATPQKRSRGRSPAAGASANDIVAADAHAAKALQGVTEDPRTQLDALDAVEALVAACTRAGATVLAREAARLLDERRDTLRAFHLEKTERLTNKRALAGAVMQDETVAALEAALVVLGQIDGDSGAVRTLRARLDDVKRGLPGKPRPFFARYLEHQKR